MDLASMDPASLAGLIVELAHGQQAVKYITAASIVLVVANFFDTLPAEASFNYRVVN
ncbi:hypothetical protein EST38_g2429 [Candolleomyces aberdarensis]|uniref:Uncharacterized protein n=1 Tax=Candolleomyces aberdarensis TaxID=2316362 RepID=A0A4Q2DT63_9AGAR|nr:hypothetical protein EST38_g2429 [Candolleomyces aberdarensis]